MNKGNYEKIAANYRYNKSGNYENWYLYKKQRDFCVSLLRKTKNSGKLF